MPPTTPRRNSINHPQYRKLGVPSTHGWLWAQRQRGSFFVPTLAPVDLMAEGLRTASEMPGRRIDVRAKVCVYKGLLGVMFSVR
jgi:hypothetical protein